MSATKITAEGRRIIASNIIGQHKPINYICVCYGPSKQDSVPNIDLTYLEKLAKGTNTGYGLIAVTHKHISADNTVNFTGLLTDKDLIGGKLSKKSMITSATLVHSANGTLADATFIYSALINPVNIVAGAYISVTVGFSIGDNE